MQCLHHRTWKQNALVFLLFQWFVLWWNNSHRCPVSGELDQRGIWYGIWLCISREAFGKCAPSHWLFLFIPWAIFWQIIYYDFYPKYAKLQLLFVSICCSCIFSWSPDTMSYLCNFFCKSFCLSCVYDEGKKKPPQLYCVPWKRALPMISMGERAGSESQWKIGFKNVLLSGSKWACL